MVLRGLVATLCILAATAAVYELTLVTADDRMIDRPGLSVLANRSG